MAIAAVLLVAVAAAGAANLGLATNYRVFFGADNPDLALVSGIGTRRVIWWTWVMGAVLAATAGFSSGDEWWNHHSSWGSGNGLAAKLDAFETSAG